MVKGFASALVSALVSALAAVSLAGCASRGSLAAPVPDEVAACSAFFAALDAAVDGAGVRDAQDSPIAGFAYLRVSRLAAAERPASADDEVALKAWADGLRRLDAQARRHETANLPGGPQAFPADRVLSCGAQLLAQDLARPDRRQALVAGARVPDDYSDASRVIGLYPLSRHPFTAGVRRHQRETVAAFAREGPTGPAAARLRVTPRLETGDADPARVALFDAHAPVFELEVDGDHDRFGAVGWGRDGLPAVDPGRPVAYVHEAGTRYGGRTLRQLVYTVWFAERPSNGPLDLLAGRLDGLTWRVTLAPDGAPLVYDTIHPCGCYHMFFPTPRAAARPAPPDEPEWALMPRAQPLQIAPGERPLLRLAARTHFLERVGVWSGAAGDLQYRLRDYDDLRSMPLAGGGRRSLFGPDGLVAGTERGESMFFWPMGIASAGAMRQWGRHATAFVGRRHFDDADLFEKRFDFEL